MTLPLLLVAVLATSVSAVDSPFADGQDSTPPPCFAEVSWANDTQISVSRAGARPLTLFSVVGRGSCSAVIQLSAVYFDSNDDVVCSGQVDIRIPYQAAVPYTHLEVRPGNIYEFLRWRNGPRPTTVQWSRLTCLNPDGQTEAQQGDLDRAQSLRLHATVVPTRSGLATAELRMLLQP